MQESNENLILKALPKIWINGRDGMGTTQGSINRIQLLHLKRLRGMAAEKGMSSLKQGLKRISFPHHNDF